MTRDPGLRAVAREAVQRRKLSAGATCPSCGTTRHLTPTKAGVCYADLPTTALAEVDHPAGRAHMPRFQIAVHPNWHREVTEIRTLLSLDDWPSREGDPLLLAARFLAAAATLFLLLANWLRLAADAIERAGIVLPASPFAP